jgi:hypothetical protein
VVIQGRLKIVGSGANLVAIGRTGKKTGLSVGQSLEVHGGTGSNELRAERFSIGAGLHIVNGVGSDIVDLKNFRIGGNVSINNGSGGAATGMSALSAAAGFNKVAGHVTILNGAGEDRTLIIDTNVGGNITVHNGPGDAAGEAGYFLIQNAFQKNRSTIGGNVTVTFLTGNSVGNGILDAVVRGNVLFNNGSGSSETYFDGLTTVAPVVILGRLKIAGTGQNLVSIGRQFNQTGLRVGRDLVIAMKNPADLTLRAFNLIVNGQTKLI